MILPMISMLWQKTAEKRSRGREAIARYEIMRYVGFKTAFLVDAKSRDFFLIPSPPIGPHR